MKPVTNTKFINNMIDAHPLAQIFIIEAINRYAELCSENRLPEDHIISADAWQQCALNLKTIIDNRNK